jgi:hypothetical protein
MNIFRYVFGVFAVLAVSVFAFRADAQEHEHLQVGVFADYFNSSQTSTSSFGVGGRLAVPIFWRIRLEGEMGYDFDRVFTEGFTDNATGSISAQRTNMRILHGEFGPKLDLGHGRFHPFVFAKGGFVNYNLSAAPATEGTFVSSVDNLRAQKVNAVFYPGGGVQGHIGPVGLRFDVGDEMYFNHGTHNNLRAAFGPFLRF